MRYARMIQVTAAVFCMLLAVPGLVWSGDVEHIVATVNGEAITLSDLQQEIVYRQISDPALAFPPTRQEKKLILERLIDRMLLLQEAAAQSISAEQEAITKRVDSFLHDIRREYPSGEAFERELETLGIDVGQLREELRTLETERVQINQLVARRVVMTEEEVEAYKAELQETKQPIVSYHLAHILLGCSPTTSQEEVDATEQRAYALLIKIQEGTPFETIVHQASEDPSTKSLGGDMGYVDAGAFDPVIEEAVAGLEVGQLSSPVRNAAGFHIFKLLDKRTARDFLYAQRFAEAQDLLIDQLRAKADLQIFEQFL